MLDITSLPFVMVSLSCKTFYKFIADLGGHVKAESIQQNESRVVFPSCSECARPYCGSCFFRYRKAVRLGSMLHQPISKDKLAHIPIEARRMWSWLA